MKCNENEKKACVRLLSNQLPTNYINNISFFEPASYLSGKIFSKRRRFAVASTLRIHISPSFRRWSDVDLRIRYEPKKKNSKFFAFLGQEKSLSLPNVNTASGTRSGAKRCIGKKITGRGPTRRRGPDARLLASAVASPDVISIGAGRKFFF